MIKLSNVDIWYSSNEVYLRNAMNRLIRITGKDVEKIKEVITFLTTPHCDVSEFQSELVSKSDFNEIISYLQQNNLVELKESESKKNKTIGVWSNKEVIDSLKIRLPEFTIIPVNSESDLKEINLLIVISPIYENYNDLLSLSTQSYKRGINLLYFEITPISFTIGPLVIPKSKTASLNCFLKRRLMNVHSPKLYTDFISSHKEKVSESSVSKYPYFLSTMVQMEVIIRNYFNFNTFSSQYLIEKSITMNYWNFSIENATVLKDPSSELFKSSTYSPFNG